MSHFITSREGFFIFNKENGELLKIMDGHFYGFVRRGHKVFIFGFEGNRKSSIPTGCIWSFYFMKNNFSNWKKEVDGLDNGSHHMVIFEECLYIIETYVQRLTKFRIDEDDDLIPESREHLYIWGKGVNSHYTKDPSENANYLHINSMTVQDGRFFFMSPSLKNDTKCSEPSRIQVWNPINWTMIDEYELGRWFCHDLVCIGHEMYFCDAESSVCKLNLITRSVSQVLKLYSTLQDHASCCRGLSISDNEQIFASSKTGDNWCGIFNDTTKYKTKFTQPPSVITRIDGKDFNNLDSFMRKSYIRTKTPENLIFFSNIMEHVNNIYSLASNTSFSTDQYNSDTDDNPVTCEYENEHKREVPTDLSEFLNPNFETITNVEKYIKNKERVHLEGKSSEIDDIISNGEFNFLGVLIRDGYFNWYPREHGMGWHNDSLQTLINPNFNFRLYLIRTSGRSFFLYRHPYTSKIHAVHDIDQTINIFHVPLGGFWHAVSSTDGERLSVGWRTGIHGMDYLGLHDFSLRI
jgi:hypothetical protein